MTTLRLRSSITIEVGIAGLDDVLLGIKSRGEGVLGGGYLSINRKIAEIVRGLKDPRLIYICMWRWSFATSQKRNYSQILSRETITDGWESLQGVGVMSRRRSQRLLP